MLRAVLRARPRRASSLSLALRAASCMQPGRVLRWGRAVVVSRDCQPRVPSACRALPSVPTLVWSRGAATLHQSTCPLFGTFHHRFLFIAPPHRCSCSKTKAHGTPATAARSLVGLQHGSNPLHLGVIACLVRELHLRHELLLTPHGLDLYSHPPHTPPVVKLKRRPHPPPQRPAQHRVRTLDLSMV